MYFCVSCAGSTRVSTSFLKLKEDVDGRIKSGHDELGDYRPLNTALRFSMKAVRPSA